MLGVSWFVPLTVVWPLSASIGFAASAPEKDWMPPTRNAPPATPHVCDAGSPGAAVLRENASGVEGAEPLFMRRRSVHPAGGVRAALEFLKPMAAIITSFAAVPVGVEIERL